MSFNMFTPDSSKGIAVERVILITIDTLRADHLGAYGYIQNTSPFFDSMVKQGILFKNTFAAMATTTPSHAALFTSLYPIQLGVLKNGDKLGDAVLTMAEMFQKMGYKTAGIVSTVGHFKAGNLHQGFEYFNEPEEESIFTGGHYRKAQETINTAMKWLDTVNSREKFLLWIHLFDPHRPLQPPQAYYERLTRTSDRSQLIKFFVAQQHVDVGFFDNNTEQMIHQITQYDAEILYVDAELQRFYEYYNTKGGKTNSLWIITADHGEGVGNHNWWIHGKHIYNEQLRIPLLLYFSSGVGKGRVIEEVVEHVDLLPTILDLVRGNSLLTAKTQGESLLPLLFPQRTMKYQKTYAFSQRRVFEKTPKKIDPKTTNYEEGEKFALQSREYKYIYRTVGTSEFFDLRVDPYETNNLINSDSHKEQKLREALLTKIEALRQDTPIEHLTVDKKAIEQLRSLGYTQ